MAPEGEMQHRRITGIVYHTLYSWNRGSITPTLTKVIRIGQNHRTHLPTLLSLVAIIVATRPGDNPPWRPCSERAYAKCYIGFQDPTDTAARSIIPLRGRYLKRNMFRAYSRSGQESYFLPNV